MALTPPLTVASAHLSFTWTWIISHQRALCEATQLPCHGVQGLDRHSQPSLAFHPAMHVYGKVAL